MVSQYICNFNVNINKKNLLQKPKRGGIPAIENRSIKRLNVIKGFISNKFTREVNFFTKNPFERSLSVIKQINKPTMMNIYESK